jgi:hypothetical protein
MNKAEALEWVAKRRSQYDAESDTWKGPPEHATRAYTIDLLEKILVELCESGS